MTDRSIAAPSRSLAALAVLLLAASACTADRTSGSASETASDPSSSAVPATPAAAGHACDQGATIDDVVAVPVPGVDSDLTLTSFDGTPIRIHWFPVDGASAAEPKPTILMGPGWSLAGDTSVGGAPIFGALSISGMHDEGYNVLTWDPRGFGKSGGEAQVNYPGAEGRDTQALLDFVAAQPQAQLDDKGDPRVGMVGVSYGGGIQLTLSAIDCRVDAIVPNVSWHSLETSLFKSDTVKAGWAATLSNTGASGKLDPHIKSAAASGLSEGTLSEEDHAWFISRGPGDLVNDISIPTLFVAGTVDTLFTLDEDIVNYRILRDNDVPTAMLWYCGGHGTCLTKAGDTNRFTVAAFAWLDRYLRGNESAKLGPTVDLIDQDGTRWVADDYPADDGPVLTAESAPKGSAGKLSLTADGGAGPLPSGGGGKDALAGIVNNITPAKADNAIDVTVGPFEQDELVIGAPGLTFTYSGTTPDGSKPTRLFAQLVDDKSGLVVGNQITPIEVTLDGKEHTADLALEVIAHHVAVGNTFTLQLVASTVAYAVPRLGGAVTVTDVKLTLPTPDGFTKG